MPKIHSASKCTRVASTTLFVALATLAGTIAARAASDSVCRDYAQRAVAQNAENERLGCGFGGPRWHGGESGHFVFCKAATDQFVHAELNTRAGKLRECQATANADAVGRFQQEQNVVVDVDEGNDASPLVGTPREEVLIDTAVDCKLRRVSVSAQHESPSEAERLSLSGWEELVGSSYGRGFSDVGKAREAELNCSAGGNRTECTFSGFPCNG